MWEWPEVAKFPVKMWWVLAFLLCADRPLLWVSKWQLKVYESDTRLQIDNGRSNVMAYTANLKCLMESFDPLFDKPVCFIIVLIWHCMPINEMELLFVVMT